MSQSADPSWTGNDGLLWVCDRVFDFFKDGWLLMVLFGVLHASAASIPALGYWQCAFLGVVIVCLCGTALAGTALRIRRLGKLVASQSPSGVLSDVISKYLTSSKTNKETK